MKHVDTSLIDRARIAANVIRPLAGEIESARGLPQAAVRALVSAGVFKLYVPKEYGGSEASLASGLGAIEEIAHGDGSAGWCAMIGATSGLMAAFVDESVAREVYGAGDAITCGVFAPMGRAVRVENGFRVTGRWPFASGCMHSKWRMGGTIVEGDPPDLLPSGAPNVQSMLFPERDTTILDTWDTSGLRGTGSHDFEVKDVFVPATHSFSLVRDTPRHQGPPYRLPFFGVLAANIAAVALGIARSAIEGFVGLAKVKVPAGSRRPLSHRESVQLDVAAAKARVYAARAHLHEIVAALQDGEGPATLPDRARLRLAAWHAATEAAAAVDLMYNAGGASAVYAASPLQRHFRDVHVATQHIMVSRSSAELAGRVMLGVESNTDTL